MSYRLWTPQEIDLLRQRYQDTYNKELSNLLNRSSYSISQKARNLGLHKSQAFMKRCHVFQFQKGCSTWNKGMKGRFKQIANTQTNTRFKPGNIPVTTLPVGSEVVDSNGYLSRKIAEPNVWELTHRLVWQEAHGPIPQGHIVVFKDGNPGNISLDNLECRSRADHARHNSFLRFPPELRDAIKTFKKLKRELEKHNEKQDQ